MNTIIWLIAFLCCFWLSDYFYNTASINALGLAALGLSGYSLVMLFFAIMDDIRIFRGRRERDN